MTRARHYLGGITDAERIRRITALLKPPPQVEPFVRQTLHEMPRDDLHRAFTELHRSPEYLTRWRASVALAEQEFTR